MDMSFLAILTAGSGVWWVRGVYIAFKTIIHYYHLKCTETNEYSLKIWTCSIITVTSLFSLTTKSQFELFFSIEWRWLKFNNHKPWNNQYWGIQNCHRYNWDIWWHCQTKRCRRHWCRFYHCRCHDYRCGHRISRVWRHNLRTSKYCCWLVQRYWSKQHRWFRFQLTLSQPYSGHSPINQPYRLVMIYHFLVNLGVIWRYHLQTFITQSITKCCFRKQ